MTETSLKKYSLADILSHNAKDDCWVVISGKVYDVTRFLEEHPGGEEVMLEASGRDATESFEDVGHSTDARAMMKEYLIGEIADAPPKVTVIPKPAKEKKDDAPVTPQWIQWLIPAAFAIAAALAYKFIVASKTVVQENKV